MDIKDMLTVNTIEFDVDLESQEEVLQRITDILFEENRIDDKLETFKGYIDRENECTTGIGFGIAIPHCKIENVLKPTIVFLKLNNKVEWNSLDEKPVTTVIGLAIPKKDAGTLHLEILSSLACNLMEDEFKDTLFKINNKNQLINFLQNNLI